MFLISSTNYNYKQIAFMIGFKNNASFSKAFKKWTGKTPQDFRKNLDY
ncbi:helix-turn-helix domain-containing protein [Acinetobacter baumannii]